MVALYSLLWWGVAIVKHKLAWLNHLSSSLAACNWGGAKRRESMLKMGTFREFGNLAVYRSM